MKEAESILLVEDDDVEVLKVRRALQKIQFNHPVFVAEDGVEALSILRGDRKSELSQKPRMVLLDLNMPRMNGIEFLRELRSDPELKQMVVVVLTTSNHERDVSFAYEMNVAGYIVKPTEFQKFVAALSTIDSYWNLCELPRQ